MGNKRQQTMAKMARERLVKERRARKQEKRQQRKLAAAAEHSPEEALGEIGDPAAPSISEQAATHPSPYGE